MNENILNLEPKLLWKNFRELTLIPRPSKHEEKVTAFLLEFGKKYADEARSILESNKITSEVFTFTDTKGKTFYRVRIGPYVTKSEAEYWQSRVAMIDKFADSKSIIVNTKTN